MMNGTQKEWHANILLSSHMPQIAKLRGGIYPVMILIKEFRKWICVCIKKYLVIFAAVRSGQ